MTNMKKSGAKAVSHQGVVGNENIIKVSNDDKKPDNIDFSGKLSLTDAAKIINTVVDSTFIERNGVMEFAAEYYEVLLAYMEIGAFFPETGVLENGVHLFFLDYIDGKYYKELNELKANSLAQYIEIAVNRKIEAKMRQIENPLINSLTKFVNTAGVLAQKYVDDIDNVGTDDIKGFIANFAEFAKKTNSQTVTDAVIKMHKADGNKSTTKKRKTDSPKAAKPVDEKAEV
ncbi:MAG: hypothetical protein NC452_21585 [Eubacterium sp.]|nr:hypothetical protein [Eubacterium sp.]